MSARKTFDELYEKELKGLLIPFEKQRRKILGTVIAGFVLLGLSLILFLFSSSSDLVPLGMPGVICIFAGAILVGIGYNNRKDYKSVFKENIVRRVIHHIDPSFYYNPETFVSRKDYENSGLFLKKPDRYEGDDYIEGSRGKTYFCFSELKTSREEGSDNGSHTVIIFKGLFFIADFNKNFNGRTYVWSEANPQLNFFVKLFYSFSNGLEKVKLESVDFENRFIVYSNDQVEARYILTPSFMERLVKLEQLMGVGISFSFVNTNIYVAMPITESLFEPHLYKPNSYDSISNYHKTVLLVFDMIDELKLNERLWNKE